MHNVVVVVVVVLTRIIKYVVLVSLELRNTPRKKQTKGGTQLTPFMPSPETSKK